jgi:hemerythrin-like domain-containing protein
MKRSDALTPNEDLPPDSAKIIRSFIEDYHEKLEEEFLFPRFNEAELVDLVGVLFHQHQAGRALTDITMQFATNQTLKNADERRTLAAALSACTIRTRRGKIRCFCQLFGKL